MFLDMKYLFSLFILACSTNMLAQNTLSLVTTTGEAIVYAAPDEILLSFSITNEAPALKEAKTKNNEFAKKIIAYLKSAGIAPQHIQTQYMSVSPYRDYKNKNQILYYTASQSIDICIKDLTKYEQISDKLLELEVTSIGSPVFRNTEMRKYKDDARKKAIIAAREKAQLLAKELGQDIGKAHTIREVSGGYFGRGQSGYANMIGNDAPSAGGEGQSFAPGQLEVKAIIEVSFLLN